MKTAAEYISISLGNKELLERHSECSCYHCCRTFSASEIEDYVTEKSGRKTACCPKCWVDALLPGVVSIEELEYAKDICFGRKYSD